MKVKQMLVTLLLLLILVSHVTLFQLTEKVSGNETEAESESETETETEAESESETETETEAESESETEKETETESESETETETETESESETETETETEIETESESETETETEAESESETETEIETESESETETESESETETEVITEVQQSVVIKDIWVDYKNESRLYNDSVRVRLKADYVIIGEGEVELELYGKAESADVGKWKVKPMIQLSGKDAEKFRLEVPKVKLQVTIKPRPLDIEIGQGSKEYASPMEIRFLQTVPGIHISGFYKNGKPTEEIPEGFQYPELTFNEAVVQKESPMYHNGQIIVYENALIPQKNKDGSVSGNATSNYYFRIPDRGGSLILTQRTWADYQVEIRNGKGLLDTDGQYWISKNARLEVIPTDIGVFNQAAISGELKANGNFRFLLEKRNAEGELLARSGEQSVYYKVDEEAPVMQILYQEKSQCAACYSGSVVVSGSDFYDSGSGIASVEAAVYQGRKGKQVFQIYEENTPLIIDKEGKWKVAFRMTDKVGNQKTYISETIILDQTIPQIVFKGMEDGKSYQCAEQLHIVIRDSYLNADKTKIRITNAAGKVMKLSQSTDIESRRQRISINNINSLKDGNYTVQVYATDIGGNQNEATLSFRINAAGSKYVLAEDMRQMLGRYFIREGVAFAITEKNKDKLEKNVVTCVHNSSFSILQEGKDYQIFQYEEKNRWRYEYVILAKNFQEEGSYSIGLQSKDAAGNQNDSRETLKLEFFVDKTAPSCFISGLDDKTTGEQKVTVWTRDNGRIALWELWKNDNRVMSDDREIISIVISSETSEDRFQIRALDGAGNEGYSQVYQMVSKEEKQEKETVENTVEETIPETQRGTESDMKINKDKREADSEELQHDTEMEKETLSETEENTGQVKNGQPAGTTDGKEQTEDGKQWFLILLSGGSLMLLIGAVGKKKLQK